MTHAADVLNQTSLSLPNHSLIETEAKIEKTEAAESKRIIDDFLTPNSKAATEIKIISNKIKQPIAKGVIEFAENSIFQAVTQINKKNLSQSMFLTKLWVDSSVNKEWLPAILYFCLRKARISGRKNIIVLLPENELDVVEILKLEKIEKVNRVEINNHNYIAYAQHLDYALFETFNRCTSETKAFIQHHMVDEVLQTTHNWLDALFQNTWSRAIYEGTMSKQQYLTLLANTHHYVRYTTRLLGRCVALSDDPKLRDIYIDHLKGEINHERIIERDIAYLGGDVDFLMNYRVPNAAAKEFMIIQESTIAFYQDPILFLACPLSAEGITAHIQPNFIEALHRVIASWGVKEPANACRFISSHIHTDGGDDGHWEQVSTLIRHYIKDETRLQQFLSIQQAAMNALSRILDTSIEDSILWENQPY